MNEPANNAEVIFLAALDRASPAERAVYVEGACAGRPAILSRVRELLRAHEASRGPLDAPPPGLGVTQDEPPRERPGTIIGPYKLLQQIGEGGMGVVYMAEQETPVRRKLALKIIKPGMDSRQVIARFEAERQALAMMDHQNIAKVFDANTTDTGRPYFVMELVHGVPITKFCDDNKLTPRERLELFIPICQAIQHAHQKGIIHRDIKPSNVLVTMYDDKPVPKVIDFGVAKAIEQRLTEKTLYTQFGSMVGTLEYMSPEQAEMNAFGVDTRSDVYSLGVLLYELLTGSTPLESKRLRTAALDEMVRLIREEEPPRPSARLSSSGTLAKIAAARKMEPGQLSKLVRGELDWIVMKSLEKDRTRRYETASSLAKDVERYLKDEAVEACPPSAAYRLRKFSRKYKKPLAVAAGFALLLLAAVALSTWQAVRATIAEANAERKSNALTIAEAKVRADLDDIRTANSQLRDAQDDLRGTLYYARSNLLQNAWDSNNTARVLEILEQQRPKPGERDLRGFEWYYWDRQRDASLRTIAGLAVENPESPPIKPAFSPDGSRVAAQAMTAPGEGPRYAVYDLNTGKEITRLAVAIAGYLDWSPDGTRVAMRILLDAVSDVKQASRRGHVRVGFAFFDAANGKELFRIEEPKAAADPQAPPKQPVEQSPEYLTFSPDGKYLAIGWQNLITQADILIIYDAGTGQVVRTLEGTERKVVFFSPDGKRLATLAAPPFPRDSNVQAAIKVCDILTGKELLAIPQATSNFSSQLVFSPDGSRFAACVGDLRNGRMLKVWDAASGKELLSVSASPGALEPPTGPMLLGFSGPAFSPDGTRLAATEYSGRGERGDIKLWDLASGNVVFTLREAVSFFTSFRFSPDGKLLATGGATVKVWDVSAKQAGDVTITALVLRGHTGTVNRLAFHPDSSRLFTGAHDGTVKVWDVTARDQPLILKEDWGKNNMGERIAFSPLSGRIVVASTNHVVGPEQLAGQTHLPILAARSVTSLTTPNLASGMTQLLAVQQCEDTVARETRERFIAWDLTGKQLFAWSDGWHSPRMITHSPDIALSPDGTCLVSVAGEFHFGARTTAEMGGTELKVRDMETGKPIFAFQEERPVVKNVLAFRPDGKQFVWGASFSVKAAELRIWDVQVGKEVLNIKTEDGPLMAATFSPDGRRIAATLWNSGTETQKVWDVVTGQELLTMEGVIINKGKYDYSSERRQDLIFSPDGTQLARVKRLSGFASSEAIVWDAATGRKLYTLKGHSGAIHGLAFSPDSRRLATVAGSEVTIWDSATAHELQTLKLPRGSSGLCVAFSPDGTRLYLIGPGSVQVLDATPRPDK